MVVLMKGLGARGWGLAALLLVYCATILSQPARERTPDRVISVVAERFTFNPSRINLKRGELVEIVLSSEDTDHGFHIQGTSISVAIPQQGKGEARVRFIANQKGRYAYECWRPCGAGHNLMRGIITVK